MATCGVPVVLGKSAFTLLEPCHELFIQSVCVCVFLSADALWIIFSNVIMLGLKVKWTFQVLAQPIGSRIGHEILYIVRAL